MQLPNWSGMLNQIDGKRDILLQINFGNLLSKHQINMKKLILFGLSSLGALSIHAQSSVVSSGGNASGSGGSVSYSVGQVAYSFVNGNANGSLIQGVQQPLEISIVTSINNLETNISVDIYPNPTPGKLIIQVGETNVKQMTCQLISMDGKVLKQKQLFNQSTEQLDMSSLPAGTYFIKIHSKQQQLKLYKVIKNN